MGFHEFGVLRVSPNFTAEDWRALERESKEDWPKAANIVKDRLDGRFLRYARSSLESPQSGFVVLAIDCLLLETLQQFRLGITNGKGKGKGKGKSEKLVKDFLNGKRFQPYFDEKARKNFYEDIRCGLLHQAEARKMWLIRREQEIILRRYADEKGYVIDVQKFHNALELSFEDYLNELRDPDSNDLRDKLWTKMDHICNVREQRGVIFADRE